MRSIHLAPLLAGLVALAPAAAQAPRGRVALDAGETVTLAFDDGGRVTEQARGPAPRLTRFEAAAVWNLTHGVYGDTTGPVSAPMRAGENGVPEPPDVEPGVVRAKLVSLGRRSTLLVVENGYGRAVAYRAQIRVRGRTHATDVCEVMPGRFSLEHWPDPVARIELSDLRLVPWTEGQTPRCE